tara:strand:+ start:21546 stop:21908 length:363 start_codon:yes stop_codon:yes gene_type:complete
MTEKEIKIWTEKLGWKLKYENVTLDVYPDNGDQTRYIEYCFHQGDHKDWNTVGLDFIAGKDWREVKKILKTCIEYAKEGKIYEEILCIEKVWHGVEDGWEGHSNLFNLKDFKTWEGVVFG